jgi:hypothetical protein
LAGILDYVGLYLLISTAEHLNMKVKIDCIDGYTIMNAGPAYDLIVLRLLDTGQG